MRISRVIAFGVLVVAAIAVAAWWRLSNLPVVTSVAASRGTAAEIVYATGGVEPVRWAKVASVIRDRIIDICYCEGKTVSKGDLLVRLDDREVPLGDSFSFAITNIDNAVPNDARDLGPAHRLDPARSVNDLGRSAARRRDRGHDRKAAESPPRRERERRDNKHTQRYDAAYSHYRQGPSSCRIGSLQRSAGPTPAPRTGIIQSCFLLLVQCCVELVESRPN